MFEGRHLNAPRQHAESVISLPHLFFVCFVHCYRNMACQSATIASISEAIDRLSNEVKQHTCVDANHTARRDRIEYDIFEIRIMLTAVNEKLDQVINGPHVPSETQQQDSDGPVERGYQTSSSFRQRQVFLPTITREHILDLVIRNGAQSDDTTIARR